MYRNAPRIWLLVSDRHEQPTTVVRVYTVWNGTCVTCNLSWTWIQPPNPIHYFTPSLSGSLYVLVKLQLVSLQCVLPIRTGSQDRKIITNGCGVPPRGPFRSCIIRGVNVLMLRKGIMKTCLVPFVEPRPAIRCSLRNILYTALSLSSQLPERDETETKWQEN